jgi:glycosyltransferase involved in cell wall biosynthesis
VKIAYILTAPQMAGFLCGQVSAMKASGFVPTIFSPEATPQVKKMANKEGAALVIVKMKRDISPWHDLVGTLRLTYQLWKLKPEIVVTIGPKAGLLGGVAAWIVGVPCRIQTKWGIRLETARGLLRLVLTVADRIAASCAQIVLCDSESGRARTIELGLSSPQKVKVIASGSSKGIDLAQFVRDSATMEAAIRLRFDINVPVGAPIIGFVGRLNRDKGLKELSRAWSIIHTRRPDSILLVAGPSECESPYEIGLLEELQRAPGVKIIGECKNILPVYAIIDVLLMPTHREGFPNVVLEASAFSIPTTGFKVTGMRDAVIDGVTGGLVDFGDTEDLAAKTLDYLNDATLRKNHGENARARVIQFFQPVTLWQGYFETFKGLAEANDLPTHHLKWHLNQ